MGNKSNNSEPSQVRRNIVKGAVGAGVAALVPNALAIASDEPARLPPQIGDVLVFASGEHKGKVITPEDLKLRADPTLAFPHDLSAGLTRNRSRLNRIAIIRVEAEKMAEKMIDRTVDGIAAYSAICTHGGCLVELWREEDEALFCACHYSRYDPWSGGSVLGGPAPRRLPNLPLKLIDGQLAVAGEFDARIGN